MVSLSGSGLGGPVQDTTSCAVRTSRRRRWGRPWTSRSRTRS